MKTPLLLLSSFLVACGSSEQGSSSDGADSTVGAGAPAGVSVPTGSSSGGLTITQKTGPDAGKPLVPVDSVQQLVADKGFRFVTPEGWVEEKPEGSMRHRQYSLPGPEGSEPALAVVAYWPTMGGMVEANLDLWVKQVGSDKPASELGASERWDTDTDRFLATHVHVLGKIKPMEGMAKSIEATDAGAILAAFIEPVGVEGVWTIKVTGPSKTVKAHKERYVAFVAGL